MSNPLKKLFKKGNALSDNTNGIITICLCVAIPVILFFLMQLTVGGYTGGLLNFILNLLIIGAIIDLGFVISGNSNFALKFGVIIVTAFCVSNYFIVLFRGIPILAPDFTVLGTAANVAANYKFTFNFASVFFIICAIIICLGVRRINAFKIKGAKHRLSVAALYIVLIGVFLGIMLGSDFLPNRNIAPNIMRPVTSEMQNGTMLNFLASCKSMQVDRPDNYSPTEVKKIGKRYEGKEGGTDKPHLIIIIDEAFADLQSVGDFETNKEVLPVYKSLRDNTVKGNAYISTVAGGTANTEFEVLTGFNMAFLPTWTTPFQLYSDDKTPSIAWNLRDAGYSGCEAFHPYKGSGYNRETAYKSLGFEDFISEEDIEIKKDMLLREYISDSADFKLVEAMYEARKSSPYFIYNMTMSNHSSYNKDYDNMPDEIELVGDFTKEERGEGDAVENYLNLLHLSDRALGEIIDYYEKEKEDTVIFFMGDHQPELPDAFYEKIMGGGERTLSSEELMEKFKVPFLIWANYEIDDEYIESTSASYLMSVLASKAGLGETKFNEFINEMREEIPVMSAFGYRTRDGEFHAAEDGAYDECENKYIREYNNLVYNAVFDKEHCAEKIFYLP